MLSAQQNVREMFGTYLDNNLEWPFSGTKRPGELFVSPTNNHYLVIWREPVESSTNTEKMMVMICVCVRVLKGEENMAGNTRLCKCLCCCLKLAHALSSADQHHC